jgi:hypothetical protein
MKKTINKQINWKTAICLFGTILLLALSGCPGPMTGGDAATLTINLGRGGSGSRAALPDAWESSIDTDDLVHTITISDGPGAAQKQEGIKAGQTARFTVNPGTWKVTVQAYFGTVLIAEGSKNVNVKSGESSSVPITMNEAPAVFTSIEAFKLWLGTKPGNDYPYKVKLNVSNLSGAATINGSLGYLLNNNPGKLVDLDLSGSTFANNKIQEYAFSNCYGLRGIILPNGITVIGNNAFENTDLESITIPASVTEISYAAFNPCPNLTTVVFQGSSTSFSYNTNTSYNPFEGDLHTKYQGPGTYTRGSSSSSSWMKQ